MAMQLTKSTSDRAIDGLVGGLIAGLLMAMWLIVYGWSTGRSLQVTLGYFDPSQNGGWLIGLMAHLALSSVYGLLFGLLAKSVHHLWQLKRALTLGLGVLYGSGLWLGALGLFNIAETPLGQLSPVEFGLAHLIYGLVAAYWLSKHEGAQ